MSQRTHRLRDSASSASVACIESHGRGWILDGEIRQLSPRTLEKRRFIVTKLVWFLHGREFASCGVTELREFLAYLSTGHGNPRGRWEKGNHPTVRSARKPLSPRSVQTYFIELQTLFAFLVEEGVLESSPMAALKPPVVRPDQIQPFSEEQVAALLNAARRSKYPRRNEAILRLLLDTGARASELCGIRMRDVDLGESRVRVTGKGNKERTLWFGRRTRRAISTYLNGEPLRSEQQSLFRGERGEPLQRCGLLKLIRGLGRAAGIEAVRCSPHTCRHTYAVTFLRAGGNLVSLQQILGHACLTQTRRYLALVEADVADQQRRFSPMDRMA